MIRTRHLRKHNISLDEYKLKYNNKTISTTSHIKLSNSAIETNKNMIFTKSSNMENELKEILEKNNINLLQSDRKTLNGKEIDLLSLEYNVGIEMNGCLFHSEKFGKKNKSYHVLKTEIALENNINLIQIFEDEWMFKKDIVISELLHIFKKTKNIIHARKCEIKEISNDERCLFLEENHIQGDTNSTHSIGAYYDNKLYAIMCFNNKRIMNKEKNHNENTYELTRFATKNNYLINGIASRLLKYFINNNKPERIISFADRRWTPSGNDNLYTKLGFKCVLILEPDYTYFNNRNYKRHHKFAFGKSSLRKRFPEIYSNDKTEWQMMQELGYDRIWDCGKFKYELILK
jgi:hypothetical protein